ncbi:unnamed protein product [Amoebophrya sp. A120]|nr:unnamed protein product [Amoebophrya sp. A120]|eukprot:GSA120T00014545001.1
MTIRKSSALKRSPSCPSLGRQQELFGTTTANDGSCTFANNKMSDLKTPGGFRRRFLEEQKKQDVNQFQSLETASLLHTADSSNFSNSENTTPSEAGLLRLQSSSPDVTVTTPGGGAVEKEKQELSDSKNNNNAANPPALETNFFYCDTSGAMNNIQRGVTTPADQQDNNVGQQVPIAPMLDRYLNSLPAPQRLPQEHLTIVPPQENLLVEHLNRAPSYNINNTTPSLSKRITLDFLVSGGDDRLILTKEGVNKYNTPAIPQPRGIHRSSCTSNCVTDYTFQVGESLVAELLEAQMDENSSEGRTKYMEMIDSIRDQMRSIWKLPKFSNSITLCPSGSDAEYLPLLIAICRLLKKKKENENEFDLGNGILTIVSGAGEVGSGTLNAAKGKFFSNISPKEVRLPALGGNSTKQTSALFANNNSPSASKQSGSVSVVKTGNNVFQLPESFPKVEAMEVYMRNRGGHLLTQKEMDEEVKHCVSNALIEQNFQCVIVHVVAGSKTGHLIPSLSIVEELIETFGREKIIPVIDACQGRLQEGALRAFLDQEYIVLTTGSKFYGGPPFSGAVLLPLCYSKELESCEDIWGEHSGKNDEDLRFQLKHFPLFMDESLLSTDLPKMRSCIKKTTTGVARMLNWGVVLRWKMALNEIKLYHAIPEPLRDNILKTWVESVREIVKGLKSPFLECVEEEREFVSNSPRGDFHSSGGGHNMFLPRPRSGQLAVGAGATSGTAGVACTNGENEGTETTKEQDAGMMWCNTIISLICRGPVKNSVSNKQRLGLDELKKLHKLMSMDLSKFELSLTDEQKSTLNDTTVILPGPYGSHVIENLSDILASKCYIAQPVQLQPNWDNKHALTVIRVTIGAPLVYWVSEKVKRLPIADLESGNGVPRIVDLVSRSDHILLRKMTLVLENWDAIKKMFL